MDETSKGWNADTKIRMSPFEEMHRYMSYGALSRMVFNAKAIFHRKYVDWKPVV